MGKQLGIGAAQARLPLRVICDGDAASNSSRHGARRHRAGPGRVRQAPRRSLHCRGARAIRVRYCAAFNRNAG
jgi:hypothetical protein